MTSYLFTNCLHNRIDVRFNERGVLTVLIAQLFNPFGI